MKIKCFYYLKRSKKMNKKKIAIYFKKFVAITSL